MGIADNSRMMIMDSRSLQAESSLTQGMIANAHTSIEIDKDIDKITGICSRILHTQEDLDRMRYGVTNKLEPWYSAFLNMSTDPLASPSYKMQGPLPYATRNATGGSPGKTQISYDSVASLLNALM